MRASRWAPILSILIVVGSSSARAEQPPAEAKDLFARGRDLRARGDCPGAIAIFRKASEVYPAGLGSLRNIAECQEINGQYASARRTWVDLRERLGSNPSPRYDGWSQDADQALARLATRVATVIVDLTVVGSRGEPATSAGIRVTINDESLAPTLVGAPIERDPGRAVVRALGPDGHVLDEHAVDLAPGEATHVAVRAVTTVRVDASLAIGSEPPHERSVLRSANPRAAAWVSVGLGAASLVGAGISLGVFEAAYGKLRSGCAAYQSQPCDPSLQPTINEGHSAATAVNVLAIVGLVGVTGGIVVLALTPPHESRTALLLSPTGIIATGQF